VCKFNGSAGNRNGKCFLVLIPIYPSGDKISRYIPAGKFLPHQTVLPADIAFEAPGLTFKSIT
jgi:hypothetical protein